MNLRYLKSLGEPDVKVVDTLRINMYLLCKILVCWFLAPSALLPRTVFWVLNLILFLLPESHLLFLGSQTFNVFSLELTWAWSNYEMSFWSTPVLIFSGWMGRHQQRRGRSLSNHSMTLIIPLSSVSSFPLELGLWASTYQLRIASSFLMAPGIQPMTCRHSFVHGGMSFYKHLTAQKY